MEINESDSYYNDERVQEVKGRSVLCYGFRRNVVYNNTDEILKNFDKNYNDLFNNIKDD